MNKARSIIEAIISALQECAVDLERHPFADVLIRVQDGRPVMVEITSKHKPLCEKK